MQAIPRDVAQNPPRYHISQPVILAAPDDAPDEFTRMNGTKAVVIDSDFSGPVGFEHDAARNTEESWLYRLRFDEGDEKSALWPQDWLQPLSAAGEEGSPQGTAGIKRSGSRRSR